MFGGTRRAKLRHITALIYIKERKGEPWVIPCVFGPNAKEAGFLDGLSKTSGVWVNSEDYIGKFLDCFLKISEGELCFLAHRRQPCKDKLPEGYNGGWRSFQTLGAGGHRKGARSFLLRLTTVAGFLLFGLFWWNLDETALTKRIKRSLTR